MAKKVDDLPPELIEAIVEAVPDDSPESLQYVCLVASIFRVPCQKKLLHHLQIAHSILPQTYVTPIGRRHSYEEITAFLDDHPHVALYVTRVTVFFTGQASKWSGPEHKSAAESVLGRLTRIREAEFCAEAFYDAARSFSTAEVFEWSFDILRGHGTLQRLRVKSIANLPADVMCRIFHSAPALEISTTTVADFDSSFSPSPGLSARGAIKTLKLAGNNRLVETLLLRPEFSPLTNSLKNLIVLLGLSVDSQTPNNLSPFALTFLASETLEYIDIAFVGAQTLPHPTALLPSCLPRLRALDITFLTKTSAEPSTWLPPSFLVSVLAASNTPVITIVTLRLDTGRDDEGYNHIIVPDLMKELDHAFAAHPTLKKVHFITLLPKASVDGFSSALRRALPASGAKGLLVVTRMYN